MQWLSNLLYYEIRSVGGLLEFIPVPSWLDSFATAVTPFCVTVNYYFPLNDLVDVTLFIMAITGGINVARRYMYGRH